MLIRLFIVMSEVVRLGRSKYEWHKQISIIFYNIDDTFGNFTTYRFHKAPHRAVVWDVARRHIYIVDIQSIKLIVKIIRSIITLRICDRIIDLELVCEIAVLNHSYVCLIRDQRVWMEPFDRALVVPIRISPGIAHLYYNNNNIILKQKINDSTEINHNIQHSKPKVKDWKHHQNWP